MPLRLSALLAALALFAAAPPASAQETDRAQIDALARDVSRVESLRTVKDLQRSYAHYAQFALWDEMAALFAEDATFTWGEETVRGRTAIANWLKRSLGGRRGLAPGAVQAQLIDEPLVNLSPDGRTAKARWMHITLSGDGKGQSFIGGGIDENDYVLKEGTWQIHALRFHPQFVGNYENGWSNAGGGELPLVPYHFTIDESGVPVPPPVGAAPPSGASLAELEQRIASLNAEDSVRNLQNAYGYYVDRKMWDDVVDLFTADGVVEIADAGTFAGKDGVRRAMERMGAQGLSEGQLNDHPSFDTIVTVLPGAREAYTRGITLAMLGESSTGAASWEFAVFRNRFVFEDGLWKIRELRLFPLLTADYATGWGGGGTRRLAPGVIPAFTEPHPVTGQPVTVAGFRLAGSEPLTTAIAAAAGATPAAEPAHRLAEARRRLARSLAYDGVVNVSSAYGYYIDDFQWVEMGSIFAEKGNKHSPFAGYYLGRDRITGAATSMYGKAPPTRPGISFHWRIQPVIHVSHDGRSANLRTRLFQPRTAKPRGPNDPPATGILTGALFSGMYPNDQAVLENGIWRLWSLTIDEPYFTANWKEGWSAVKPVSAAQAAGQSPLVQRYPPDILMTVMGRRAEHFRGGTGDTVAWPGILPMWFHYKNPVSGRVPERYWPDSVPSLLLPESRLTANGYQMPPNGPEQDGIHIELPAPESNEMRD